MDSKRARTTIKKDVEFLATVRGTLSEEGTLGTDVRPNTTNWRTAIVHMYWENKEMKYWTLVLEQMESIEKR